MVVAVRTATAVMVVAAATSRAGWSTCPIMPWRRRWVWGKWSGGQRGWRWWHDSRQLWRFQPRPKQFSRLRQEVSPSLDHLNSLGLGMRWGYWTSIHILNSDGLGIWWGYNIKCPKDTEHECLKAIYSHHYISSSLGLGMRRGYNIKCPTKKEESNN